MTITLSEPYTSGEVPEPVEYTFQDSLGAAMTDLDDDEGWTCVFRFQVRGNDSVEVDADLDEGVATWTPVVGDFGAAGIYQGEFTATNGTNTFISDRIVWRVRPAIPEPAGS